MSTQVRSVVASLLLAVPVLAEATHLVGDQWWGEVLFSVTQAAGWTLLATVIRALTARTAGAGRWGPRLVMGGVVLEATFALLYLASFVVSGEPSAAVWPVFLAGFLALTVGGVTWARGLRRLTSSRIASAGLMGVAVLGFAAMAIGSDPFHDIALVGSYLAWILVGRDAGDESSTRDAEAVGITASTR